MGDTSKSKLIVDLVVYGGMRKVEIELLKLKQLKSEGITDRMFWNNALGCSFTFWPQQIWEM